MRRLTLIVLFLLASIARGDVSSSERMTLRLHVLDLINRSGTDIARQLRARTGIPAIAISGFGLDEDLRRSKEAGFARHLIKPVNFQVLHETIRQVLSTQPIN